MSRSVSEPRVPAHIRRHFSKQQRSGLSIKAYCEKHSLSLFSFYGWRKRYRAAPAVHRPRRASFHEAGVFDIAGAGAVCDVRFPSGVTLSIRQGAAREDLETVFGLVQQVSAC